MSIPTLNVSQQQIEADLRAGKSIDAIAQEWSEPRANVYAVKRAMDAAAAAAPAPSSPAPPLPLSSPPLRAVPQPKPAAAGDVTALVEEASRSRRAATRRLGARLDELVEDLVDRLNVERKEAAEQAAAERQRAEAAAEVERLEEQLRAARAKLGPKPKGNAAKQSAPAARPADAGPRPAVVREWARQNDVDCPAVGRVPARVVDAYRSAVGDT